MKLSDDEDTKLKYLKDAVEDWEQYWKPNNDRYNNTFYFVCVSTLSTADEQELPLMARPPMQFNSIEAYGSKLLGEFSEEEPGVTVGADDGVVADQQVALTVECVEAHMRHDLEHSNNDNAGYKVMRDLLYGGFGCFEAYTDYKKGSFDCQVPHQRVNPTFCGWDPMALESHKGDGKYCYKKIYMTKDNIRIKYGDDVADAIQFDSGDSAKFAWAYKTSKQDVAVIIEFYWKYERAGKLVKLPPDLVNLPTFKDFGFKPVMDKKVYKKILRVWLLAGPKLPPPQIINERDETFCEIYRYTFCGNKLIKADEMTDYDMLPLIFVDGNSVEVQTDEGGALQQYTKPMFYNAIDAQRFKDFAGQSLAGELETMMKSYAIGPKEAFDEQMLANWLDPNRPSLLTYNSMYKNDPNFRLEKPEIITRPDIPQSIIAAFFGSDKLIETTMGFYDDRVASDPNSSGAAIKEAQLQSEGAASPYRDGFFEGLNRLAQFKLNMYPKCFKTPRSIPILLKNGKRGYAIINTSQLPQRDPDADKDLAQNHPVSMDYDPDSLLVKVEPGPSSSLQKRQALAAMNSMMQESPMMAEFILGPCLELYLSNYEMRNIEQMKAMVGPFQAQQQQKMAQQNAMAIQMQQMQIQMQQQAQQIQGMIGQAQAQKLQAEAAAIPVKLQLEDKKIENKEAVDVATTILDGQKQHDDFNIDVAKIVLEKEKNTEAVLLSKQQLASDQIGHILHAEELDAQASRDVNEHVLEIAKHEHQVHIDNESLKNEKESAVEAAKGD